jgi:two-component system response regulator GlrR
VDGVSAAETARLPVSEEALPFPDLKAARARATERFERAYLEDALRRSGGNVSKAAELAGVTRQLLHRLLKRHGIER